MTKWALLAACLLIVWVGFGVLRRRATRKTAGRELVLLADAIAVEHAARALLADGAEALAMRDAVAPFDMEQVGYGKGLLAARIAVGQAIWARRRLEYGEDFTGATICLNLAKRAFAVAEEKAKRAMIMASVNVRT